MVPTRLAFTEAGEGRRLLFLHGSAGSSALWRRQIEAFSRRYRVIAPDLVGYGKTAPWPTDTPFRIDDEVHLLEATVSASNAPLHVVGYSYGGVVALSYALANRDIVASLTLIEPVAFYALRYADEREAFAEVSTLRREFLALMTEGDTAAALRLFLDYWTGNGSWDALGVKVRVEMLANASKISLDWEASFGADPGRDALAVLTIPTLLLHGRNSPRSTQRITTALEMLLPAASLVQIEGAGHMLPLTHGADLIRVLTQHLDAADRSATEVIEPRVCCRADASRTGCGDSA
jgi:pimeloyl-ACP methyl ester carboxylesterase